MKTKRLNLFSRIFLAITDFRIYPFTQKESFWTALGYFVKFNLLVSVIIAFSVVWVIYDNSVSIVEEFEKSVSNFQISDGILTSDASSSGELVENVFYFLDSDKTVENEEELIKSTVINYDYYLLFVKNESSLIAKMDDEYVKVFGLNYDLLEENINKSELVEQWKEYNESYLMRLFFVVIITIFVFAIYFVVRIWSLILNLISALLINFIFMIKLKFSGYLKLVIYATTLSSILELISIVAIHKLPENVGIVTSIITFVYIYYGLRTIKIDELIMAGIGNSPEERIKDALIKAQKEIQEQLDEMEKEDKEKASKKNDDSNLDADDKTNVKDDSDDEPKE